MVFEKVVPNHKNHHNKWHAYQQTSAVRRRNLLDTLDEKGFKRLGKIIICFLICRVWEKYNKSLDHRKIHVGREFRISLCQPPAQSRRVSPDGWSLWASPDGVTRPLGHLLQCLTALRGKIPEVWTSPPSTSAQSLSSAHQAQQWRAWLPTSDSLLVATGWGMLLSPPKPSLLQTEPAQLPQPLCKDVLLHFPSLSLNCSVPISCDGAAKIYNTSQTHKIIFVSIFPTVEEQLMRWQSETFKRQIMSQVEYHRSWFLV